MKEYEITRMEPGCWCSTMLVSADSEEDALRIARTETYPDGSMVAHEGGDFITGLDCPDDVKNLDVKLSVESYSEEG